MRGWLVTVVLGLALVADAAVWTAWQLGAREGYEACLVEPIACSGQHHALPLQRVYAIDGPTAEVGRPQGRIRVRGELPDVSVGDEITVLGTFGDDGVLVLDRLEAHPLRPAKRRLGLVGAVVIIGLLPLVFTVRRWRVVPRWVARG